ncbi:hypothetical protein ACROYT_G027202 [Oculina patagonica]
MAKASSLAEDLSKELECAVCLEQYKEPKVLPCLHSFCKKCLEGLLTKETKNVQMSRIEGTAAQARSKKVQVWKITCPTCRISVEIPQGQIDSLPVNFFLNNLLSVVALHEDSSHAGVQCDICDSGDPPVKRCSTCCSFLCEFCSQAHLRARGTSSHNIMSLEEAKQMGSVAMAKPSLCKEHEGEVMKLFCVTCDKAICRDCTVVEHRDHEYTFVREAYSTGRESLQNILSETKTRVPMLEDALQSVLEMKTRVQSRAEQTVQEVIKCCEELTACVNIRREGLIQLTEELKKGKLKALQIQQEELEMALASVKNSVEFTEKALKNGSEVEVLNMHKQMSSRLEGFNSAKWQLKPCTDDVVKLNVDMKQLTQEMKNFGAIASVEASAARSTVRMDNGLVGMMHSTLCREQITFTITAKKQNGKKRWSGGDIFEAEIRCNEHSTTERLNVKDCEDGTYTFSYTPQQVGQYDLSVKLSNCRVRGSPFKLNVEDLYARYGASTVTMGNGEEGVMYNMLCGQPVEFTINTKEQQPEKTLGPRSDIFKVEICSSSLFSPERLPVKNKGNGCYSFCYTPIAEGVFHLSIKVEGIHLQRRPFTWNVVKWNLTVQPWKTWKSFLNLVDENQKAQYIQNIDVWSFGIPSVLTSLGSVGFGTGKYSWKVRISVAGNSKGVGIGVAKSTEENPLGGTAEPKPIRFQWFWTTGEPHIVENQLCSGYCRTQLPFLVENNDVIELYLDCDNRKLIVYHPDSKRSDTIEIKEGGHAGRLFPAFLMCSNGDEVSLRL